MLNPDKICNKELYAEVAKELNESESLVEEIIKIQSKFTIEVMERGAFETILYPYLGKIKPRLKKVQMINHMQGANKK